MTPSLNSLFPRLARRRNRVKQKEMIMSTVWRRLAAELRKDKGVTAIEYALIAALIAVIIISSITLVGDEVQITFNTWSSAVHAAISGS